MTDSQGQPPYGFEKNDAPTPPEIPGQPAYPQHQQYPQGQYPQQYSQQQYPQQQQQYPQQQYPNQGYQQAQYGAPPPAYGYPNPYAQPTPNNGLGVAGFVCGLLGLVFFWVPFFGLVLGILGVILGAAGMSAGRKSGAGTGLALTGLVLGIISLVPAIIVIAALSNT